MEFLALSRRTFIEKLVGAAAVTTVPAIPLAANAETIEPASISAPPADRLHELLAEMESLVAQEFPEYKSTIFKPGDEGFIGFIAIPRPKPPAPPTIEFDGPGIYEIRLKRWSDDFRQRRYVDVTPKGHRFAGQFRLRPAVEGSRARWWYVPKEEFSAIMRV